MPDFETTQSWWRLLCGLAGVNLLAWLMTALWLHRGDARPWPAQRLQLLLSCVYVLGCGYRSVLPVFDVPRVVLVDSFASSVVVGRTVATVAELSFAAQWALLMRGAGVLMGHGASLWAARLVLPLIALAEVNSWYAVLTTRNLGHVVEESLWGLTALICVTAWLLLLARGRALALRQRVGLALAAALGASYAAYMFAVDVPMYWTRWLADEAVGKVYPSVGEGLLDAASRWVVSQDWRHWRSEVIWMTSYFSVAVWISIALAHVRLPGGRLLRR